MRNRIFQEMPTLVTTSPLRKADPRAKLILGLASSLTVMMPFERLLIFILIYSVFLIWARLMPQTLRQIWRLKYLLVTLFIVDSLFVDVQLAVTVTLRLIILTGVLALFVCTTTPEELRLALEKLGIPFRYAFSLSMAFQSAELIQQEWHAIREAQISRGLWADKNIKLKYLISQLGEMVALTVPAVVLTARRAWAITEAASARGFDAPHRKPYRNITMRFTDWLLLSGSLGFLFSLALLRI